MTAPTPQPKDPSHRSFSARAIRFVLGTMVVLFLAIVAGILSSRITDRESTNELGLSRADLTLGGPVNLDDLRREAETVAEKYLSEKQSKIAAFCGGDFTASPDYSLTASLQKLGYRSSFYYSHWSIYLPFRLRTGSGGPFLAIIQLSDKKNRRGEGFGKLEVLRCIVLDENGRRKGQLGN